MATDSWLRSGYHSVNSYLVADSPDALIAWLCEVFDGTERGVREIAPDGRIGHAEMQLGDSMVMFSQASPDHPARPSVNYVYVSDVESVYRRAVTGGATRASRLAVGRPGCGLSRPSRQPLVGRNVRARQSGRR